MDVGTFEQHSKEKLEFTQSEQHLAREVQRGVAILVGGLRGRPVVEEVADAGTVPPAGGPDERSVTVVVNGLYDNTNNTNNIRTT